MIYIKNIFKISFVIIGTIIGAGFASGKEIYTFFCTNGLYGFFSLCLSNFLIGIILYISFKFIFVNNIESYRPVLAEVQALVAPCAGNKPLRSCNGFDYSRASMLLAVLEKRGGLKVSQCDAYLNIIGGLTLDEPAADLAAVVAIASSYLDKPVSSEMAAMGEVGLSGEIRSISHLEQRLSEVQRLGFTKCIVPAHRAKELKALPHLELLPVQTIAQALQILVRT